MLKQIWTWLTRRVFKLPEKQNSGGDIIRNNPELVRKGLVLGVGEIWELKDKGENATKVYASKLISRVIEPLPDGIEEIVKVLAVPKACEWIEDAFTMKLSKDQAVNFIMAKLVKLP